MKLVKFMFFAAVVILMAACGGTSGYNAETCEQLKTKIDKHETLTDQDYNEMIDQTVAIIKDLDKQIKACGDDSEKMSELKKNEEYTKMAGYAIGFGLYMSFNEKDLPESVKEKLKKAEAELKGISINL